jgi:tetratricopeptide (TPR) repeat protein
MAAAGRLPEYYGNGAAARVQIADDLAWAHDAAGADAALARGRRSGTSPDILLPTQILVDHALGRWADEPQALKALRDSADKQRGSQAGYTRMQIDRLLSPFVAYGLAASGDLAAARAMIEPTPQDCYTCLRMRGRIAAAARDWPAAGRWFDAAARQSPQLPFAYADWGEMLLAKGDVDGAIARLAIAQSKGPHWADPLELWGEALLKKGDKAGAVAKFREAARYAPHWERNNLLLRQTLARSGASG